ncbi:MAG TPA: RDD family protein [Candidatus Sulfotelmatobacter sp.]|nr:RDD family protein [Candidatus Sulfotelmatobacter sp.]
MFCSNCGAPLIAGAAFCARCGARVASATPVEPPAPAYSSPAVAPPGASAPAPGAPVTPESAWAMASATTAPPVRYAGFWRRFWAVVLDGLILQIVLVPIGWIVSRPNMAIINSDDLTAEQLWSFLSSIALAVFISAILEWIYHAGMESSARQATLGKMALGMRVTDLQGRRISFLRATGRHFGHVLSNLTCGVGYIMQVFTARRQALHDLVAGTLIVRADN